MKRTLTFIVCILLTGALKAQNTQTLTLQPGVNDGYFGVITALAPSANANTILAELPAMVWTTNGDLTVTRSLFKFDLSQIPAGATIESAYLNMYADSIALNGYEGSPTYGTDNASGIYRVTGNWDRSTMTWNNQPTFTTANYVLLPQSTSTQENYINLDVTTMVDSMVAGNNNGFLLKMLQEATYYNSMVFYSPTTAIPNKQPKLVITYQTANTGVANTKPNGINSVGIFPNPASNNVNIKVNNSSNGALFLSVMDCAGKVILSETANKSTTEANFNIDLKAFAKGVYMVRVNDAKGDVVTKELAVN